MLHSLLEVMVTFGDGGAGIFQQCYEFLWLTVKMLIAGASVMITIAIMKAKF